MNLLRYRTAPDFAARAEPFLVAHEVEHNLMLGLMASLVFKPDLYPSQPYFAVVEAGAVVIAAALMTPPHNLAVSRQLTPEAAALIARDVQAFRRDTPGVTGPVPSGLRFAEAWQTLTGEAFHKKMAERIYQLERVVRPVGVLGHMRRITEADRPLLLEWIRDFQLEAFGESQPEAVERNVTNMLTLPPEYRSTFLWEDARPVSLVSCGGPTPHSLRIGPVYTPPAVRGHGYASALTACVSQHILDSGRAFCTLFTDLANPTSNKIYQAIGYQPMCDVDEYRLAKA